MQFLFGDELTSLAEDSWSRNIPFEPKRGEILDRNGVGLATNISAPTVYVIPRQIENPGEAAEQLASDFKYGQTKGVSTINEEGNECSDS